MIQVLVLKNVGMELIIALTIIMVKNNQ